MSGELAIEVRSARKSYGRLEVLKGLDMNVPYGSIYGLLGSSGCGKTTLLRCILGRLGLKSGSVVTLGKPPGAQGHTVPGKDVGYMPQELALYGSFTILETMYYFGILHGMSRGEIKKRGTFLLELLELPSQRKIIKKLSGGQQRRASFAVAMLQEPPLLILDEPTVGVDPLLRAKIWHHLLQLVSSQQTTIIITTHYIEEARQAHVVGLMRDGKLLAEDAPNALIQSYNMTTLEEVFLQLCRSQDGELERTTTAAERVSIQCPKEEGMYTSFQPEEDSETTPLLQETNSRPREEQRRALKCGHKNACSQFFSCSPASCLPRPLNLLALCWKNFTRILRNPALLMFQFLMPTLQVVLFCLAVGRNLEGVKVTYVNSDVGAAPPAYCKAPQNTTLHLGDLYMSKLRRGNTFAMHEYRSITDAIEQVRKANAWMAIGIGENFTEDLFKRLEEASSPDPAVLNGSTIHLYVDVTNAQITATIQNDTAGAFELFLKDIIQICDYNASIIAPPVKIEQPPVYGALGRPFTDYMGPGIITSITLGMSIGLTAVTLIVERNEGLIDRTWVAGVNATEIILAQVVTQLCILVVQITLMVTVIVYGFKVHNEHGGNLPLIGVLALLQGLTGMGLGLLISAICSAETSALQLAVAMFYPTLLLSGVLWPLEGMPNFLRYFSYTLPVTFPAEAMRAIMGRGWGLSHLQVWRGFLVSIAWFLLFLFVAGVALRLKK